MRVVDCIRKTRDGMALQDEEIRQLVSGFSNGAIPDYQISAWLMAAWLKGLSADECSALTRAMKESGDSMKWKEWSKRLATSRFADKHSTGGVGDKVSLLLAPLAAALGLKVPMMSGRSLGHTGGTIDKLESIPGFQVFLEQSVLLKGLEEFGVAMMGQSEKLCPADRKLYALRDVTGTVESIPLITASIVSKKWAEGVDAIVYDVKCGEAAFMKQRDQARALAQSLVAQSQKVGMAASACITPMNEPWGSCVGNSLEVSEVLWILDQNFPDPKLQKKSETLVELTLQLCAEMSFLAGLDPSRQQAYTRAKKCLENGEAKRLFHQMCRHQGAQAFVDGQVSLPRSTQKFLFRSPKKGFVRRVKALPLGELGLELGLGRKQLDSRIHPGNGFVVWVSEGDFVTEGDPLLELHFDSPDQKELVEQNLKSIFEISEERTDARGDNKGLDARPQGAKCTEKYSSDREHSRQDFSVASCVILERVE